MGFGLWAVVSVLLYGIWGRGGGNRGLFLRGVYFPDFHWLIQLCSKTFMFREALMFRTQGWWWLRGYVFAYVPYQDLALRGAFSGVQIRQLWLLAPGRKESYFPSNRSALRIWGLILGGKFLFLAYVSLGETCRFFMGCNSEIYIGLNIAICQNIEVMRNANVQKLGGQFASMGFIVGQRYEGPISGRIDTLSFSPPCVKGLVPSYYRRLTYLGYDTWMAFSSVRRQCVV